ncbi:AbrB/MazE/SpoVT family DNA-binding domain-containing protein [Jeotgalibacillus salarius]|uniref:AbrB/MazE/SpoVT family DNA-binding domain-containing protein n=1 Tax=Jeotgalibacillus salarius TaxID=546023 RepID=A0A4Y8LLL5_9BACL|nr:AbrB/MazE/SpoVT family DNA-binding domain-containing protein [Jeotgalibacillus salarius]TFE02863.1 AbrB/MazE/SpoVT family DNA-binding domain-containing protein [Jeotgalibacillus salarius]
MKALGVVRKIDELGRIVIPKEIRRINGWDTGQPMEFYTDEKGLVIKAYRDHEEQTEIKQKLQSLIDSCSSKEELQKLNEIVKYLDKSSV